MRNLMIGLLLGFGLSGGMTWAQWEGSVDNQSIYNTLESMRTLQQLDYNNQSYRPYSGGMQSPPREMRQPC